MNAKTNGVASTGARAPSISNNFIFSSFWSKSDCQLSNYCVACADVNNTQLFRSVMHQSQNY